MPNLKTELLTTLHKILLEQPAGLSEYQLINQLKSQQQPLFISANLSDPLSLFRSHFVLFHVLYQLRDKLQVAGEFELHISPLRIYLERTPTSAARTTSRCALAVSDPLRAYYLDLTHLQNTERAEVEALLSSSRAVLLQSQKVTNALHELGITQPLQTLSATELRTHYRQLVSLHHPDRGGCTKRLQRINQAMDTLRAEQLLSG